MGSFFTTVMYLAGIGLSIWTIIKIWTNDDLTNEGKILYTVGVLFLNIIGIGIYWLYGHSSSGRSHHSYSGFGSSSSSESGSRSSITSGSSSASPKPSVQTPLRSTTALLANGPEATNFYRNAPKLYTLPRLSDAFLISDPFMCWGGWISEFGYHGGRLSGELADRMATYIWVAEDRDEDFYNACCEAGYPNCYRTRASIRESAGSSVREEQHDDWTEITGSFGSEKTQRLMNYYYNNPDGEESRYTTCGFLVHGISIEAARKIVSVYKNKLLSEGYLFR